MPNAQSIKTDSAFELSRFAASGVAVVIAALHRGKPIGDKEVQHLLKLLADCSAQAPDEARGVFDRLADTVAGKHYEAG